VLCDGFNATPDDDVWYRFTATSTVHQIRVEGSPGFDAVIQLLTGACNGTPLVCRDVISAGGVEVLDASDLVVGQEYLIRVFHWSASPPSTATFSICVGPSLLPPNDNCSGAITLIPSETCDPTTATVLGATLSAPANACGGTPNDDVWFNFTATASEHIVRVTTPSTFDAVVDLRSGACNGTVIQCVDVVSGNSIENLSATGLTVGDTYFVRVYHFGGNIPANTNFTICVLGPEPVTCDANAGTLTSDGLPVCLDGGSATISAIADGNSVVPVGYETIYVLTQGTGLVIVQAGATPSFTVTEADAYTIHTLVYDPTTLDLGLVEFGVTTGFDVNALLIQGGGTICGSLDVAGAPVTVEECVTCDADAGTLTSDGLPVCLDGGSATFSAIADGNSVVPVGYETIYVLTQGPGLVIVQAGATPSFTVTEADEYTIHTLVYDPTTLDLGLVEFGVTTGFDVNALLIQGGGTICGSLDVAGAPVTVEECVTCDANAGTLTSDGLPVCLDGGSATISAIADGNSVVPVGYETIYVLTQGTGLVIVQAGATPGFTVTEADAYTIHTLVYDPTTLDLGLVEFGVTTGFDVNALLIQGGGTICGSLDVTGAAVTVEECVTCDADAGTLASTVTSVCLEDGSATFDAVPNGNAVVPTGYELIYVLTQGPGLVIVQAGATPGFTVTEADAYTIHTLVYDPTTLDLGLVEFGVTTGFDVNALLIQGGGSICGSLDVTGAAVTVEECVTCDADAGTITADLDVVCYVVDETVISATPDGNSVAPAGFETLYVLTQGPELVIVDAGATPEFLVSAEGNYTIHTLVYDPTTLDLGIIEIGVTTGFDVNALLIQGGGTICGSLDVAGAPVTVEECVTCDADAGTLASNGVEFCLVEGSATFGATPNDNTVVPAGYETIYVLTQGPGLVIVQAGATPEFTVTAAGSYTIHTLVYDPNTLDLGIVEFGVTTGFDVNGLLIQGGGSICASLDVVGAAVTVDECVTCEANAGTITADQDVVCFVDGMGMLSATPDENSVVPTGFETLFVLTQGPELVIIDAAAAPDFMVGAEGSYTIHTLVYDPLTLDLGIIEIGVTTGFDVNALLIQGGGAICGSLDVTGAPVLVEVCSACDGGDLTTTGGSTSVSVCQDEEADVIDFTTTSTSAENYAFILTDENDAIITALAGNALDFNSAAIGIYHVWGVSFNGDLENVLPGGDIGDLTSTGACIELSNTFTTVTVELCTGVADADQQVYGLYPNPTEGLVTLTYRGADAAVAISVIDASGRAVMEQLTALTSGQRHQMDLGSLAPGLYTVRLSSEGQFTTLRVMVR
jgi:hypothetical protein